MSKKYKNKKSVAKAPLQSPQTYLKSGKARNLPIYECRLNPDWRETGLATVVVARSHAGGSITWATYLIDVFCVGLKQTHYQFNVEIDEYEEMLEQISEMQELEIADYTLVHNVVYGGIAYAEDLDISPLDKDWAVSQYVLAADTDEVELLDLEFGKDGMPFYNSGPYDNVKQIIQKLDTAVGPGNYHYLSHVGGFDLSGIDFNDLDFDDLDFDDDDWEEDEDDENEDDDEGFTDFEEIKDEK